MAINTGSRLAGVGQGYGRAKASLGNHPPGVLYTQEMPLISSWTHTKMEAQRGRDHGHMGHRHRL